MQLLLIRHAVAEDRETFAETGQDDAQRPLTKPGKWKMQRIAKTLRRTIGSIDVLASSPLLRARQTAEIVAQAFEGSEVAITDTLEPDASFDAFLGWLRKQRSAEVVAVVGHEPHLGGLATWLMTSNDESRVRFGKGGATLLEFEGRPTAGAAVLQWALTPALLRRLAD